MNPSVENQSFEDPSLKRVCHQAWSSEKCPLALLAKLKENCKRSSLQTVQPVQSMRIVPMWYSGGFGVAAAAVFLVAFGLVVNPFAASPASPPTAVALDSQITKSIVDLHDRCCQWKGDHQVAGVPKDQVLLTGQVLEERLGQPILAASMPEGGWTFRGGAICKADGRPTAHLIYKQGPDAVSVFSLPRSYTPSSSTYEGTFNNHPIAGFVDSRGAYCLVGSGDANMTPQRLAVIRDRMQNSVVSTPPPASYRQTVVQTELLSPLP
jgi:hypothetical protein